MTAHNKEMEEAILWRCPVRPQSLPTPSNLFRASELTSVSIHSDGVCRLIRSEVSGEQIIKEILEKEDAKESSSQLQIVEELLARNQPAIHRS